jgi:aspartate/methionine/tyrosine aminotransferase
MKLGWIVARTPGETEAMDRLETILDCSLSVATPVQHALPALLASGETRTACAIAERTRRNLATLRAATARSAATVLDVEGGWYAILRVPETRTDEAWALTLVEKDGVHVQPGYFFDLNRGAHLVLSLLPEEDVFREATSRIVRRIDEDA